MNDFNRYKKWAIEGINDIKKEYDYKLKDKISLQERYDVMVEMYERILNVCANDIARWRYSYVIEYSVNHEKYGEGDLSSYCNSKDIVNEGK